jgi:hypothetical protein
MGSGRPGRLGAIRLAAASARADHRHSTRSASRDGQCSL